MTRLSGRRWAGLGAGRRSPALLVQGALLALLGGLSACVTPVARFTAAPVAIPSLDSVLAQTWWAPMPHDGLIAQQVGGVWTRTTQVATETTWVYRGPHATGFVAESRGRAADGTPWTSWLAVDHAFRPLQGWEAWTRPGVTCRAGFTVHDRTLEVLAMADGDHIPVRVALETPPTFGVAFQPLVSEGWTFANARTAGYHGTVQLRLGYCTGGPLGWDPLVVLAEDTVALRPGRGTREDRALAVTQWLQTAMESAHPTSTASGWGSSRRAGESARSSKNGQRSPTDGWLVPTRDPATQGLRPDLIPHRLWWDRETSLPVESVDGTGRRRAVDVRWAPR